MTHEIGHMFGMNHCDHFRCIMMNGSNHVAELDEAPLHLCPVCLRKLHYVTGIGLDDRFERLAEGYDRLGMGDEAAFVRRRLGRMRSP
jgi:archaemetzincin